MIHILKSCYQGLHRLMLIIASILVQSCSIISFEAVESYNVKRGFFHMPLHKKSGNYLGYVITCGNSRIYHAGDTDFIPEMKDIEEITIALVPVGEGKTAKDPHQAARAVNSFHPEMAVPMHYEIGLSRERDFADSIESDIIVEFLMRKIDGI